MKPHDHPHLPPDAGPFSRFIGVTIQSRREAAGMSHEDLAVKSGLSPSAIRSYEKGRRLPGSGSLEMLAKGLGVSVTELVAETERRAREAA